jgi:hypothetical protein
MDVSIVVIEDDGFIYILVIISLSVLIIEDNNRLVVLNVVVGNKVSEKYTLFGAIPGIINTIIWLVWAILKTTKTTKTEEKKYHSLVANIFGFLLCGLQFIMFFCFNKEEEDISDNLLEDGEMKVEVKEEEGKIEEENGKKGDKEKIQEEMNKKENSEYDDFL